MSRHIVFATSYAQVLWFSRWKNIPMDKIDRLVGSEKIKAKMLIERGTAPVPKENVHVLPGAKALKTVVQMVTDQAR